MSLGYMMVDMIFHRLTTDGTANNCKLIYIHNVYYTYLYIYICILSCSTLPLFFIEIGVTLCGASSFRREGSRLSTTLLVASLAFGVSTACIGRAACGFKQLSESQGLVMLVAVWNGVDLIERF